MPAIAGAADAGGPVRVRLGVWAAALAIGLLALAGGLLVARIDGALREAEEALLLAHAEALASELGEVLPAGADSADRLPVLRLDRPPSLDGVGEEWQPFAADATRFRSADGQLSAELLLASTDGALWLWLAVHDLTPVRGEAVFSDRPRADQVRLGLRQGGIETRFLVTAAAPGPISAVALGDQDSPLRLAGEWQDRQDGYALELRLPINLGDHIALSLEILDYASGLASQPARRAGTLSALGSVELRLLAMPLSSLERPLARRLQPGLRARVVDASGWVRARAGDSDWDSQERESGLLALLYRLTLAPPLAAAADYLGERPRLRTSLLDQARAEGGRAAWRISGDGRALVLLAAAPVGASGSVLLLERMEGALPGSAHQRLGGFIAAVLALLVAAAVVLLAYAGLQARRIGRLERAAATALAPDGRLRGRFPRSRAGDALGKLSRQVADLLEGLDQYADYQRNLAGRLAHELRTPLAIVRSSLEHLEDCSPEQRGEYQARAREGVERLAGLLRRLGEAARMEQAVRQAEGEPLDLCALVAGCASSYRDLAEGRELRVLLPKAPMMLRAAPELLAQMLDKLWDNALGFTPVGGWIQIQVDVEPGGAILSVANQGPPLPEQLSGRLFDSLVSFRPGGHSGHLGLGLYVVRLVASLHRGEAGAANLADGSGVIFSVLLRDIDMEVGQGVA